MGTESIEASFLSFFALVSFFIFLIVSKYSHKIRGGSLLDEDFTKPQAFSIDSIVDSRLMICTPFFSRRIYGLKFGSHFLVT